MSDLTTPNGVPLATEVKSSWWDDTVNFVEGGDGELNASDLLGWGEIKSLYHYGSGNVNAPVYDSAGSPIEVDRPGLATKAANSVSKFLGYPAEGIQSTLGNLSTIAVAAAVCVGALALIYIIFEVRQVVRAV